MGRGARFVVVGALLFAALAVSPLPGVAPIPAGAESGVMPFELDYMDPALALPFALPPAPTEAVASVCLGAPPAGLGSSLCPGTTASGLDLVEVYRPTEPLCGSGSLTESVRNTLAMGLDHSLATYPVDPSISSPAVLAPDALVESSTWCTGDPSTEPNALAPNDGSTLFTSTAINGLLRGAATFPDGGKGRLTRYPGGVGYPTDAFPSYVGWDNATFTVKGVSHTNVDNRGLWEFIGDPVFGRTFGGSWATPHLVDQSTPGEASAAAHTWNLGGADLPTICDPTIAVFMETYDADGIPGGSTVSRSWPWNYTRMLHCMYAVQFAPTVEPLFSKKTIDPVSVYSGGRYDIELSPRFGWVPESWRDLETWYPGSGTPSEIRRFRPVFVNDLVFASGSGTCMWRAGEGRIGSSTVCNNAGITPRSITALAFDVETPATTSKFLPYIDTAPPASAVVQVDSPFDGADPVPGDGWCGTGEGGSCSLRAAIQEANELAGPQEIVVPAGTYTLTIAGFDEDEGATGDLDVRDELTITGAGADDTFIDADGIDRVLHIPSPDDGADIPQLPVAISGVTITGGAVGAPLLEHEAGGGGILSWSSALALTDVAIVGNAVDNGDYPIAFGGGLAIAHVGSATITNGSISSNFVGGPGASGGGIFSFGPLTVDDTVVDGNTVDVTSDNEGGPGWSPAPMGGGIAVIAADSNAEPVPVAITDSSITDNSQANPGSLDLFGGGIGLALTDATIERSVIGGNASSAGGALWFAGGGFAGTGLLIDRSWVVGNEAVDGAVVLSGDSFNPEPDPDAGGATITSSLLAGNTSYYGALMVGSASMATTVEDSTIVGNNSPGIGAVWENAPVTVRRSVLGPQLPGHDDCIVDLGATDVITSSEAVADSDGTCELMDPTDLSGMDPMLVEDTVSWPHPVWVPAAGSPLLDAGGAGCPALDLVGSARPQAAACDIGAVEVPSDADIAGRVVEDGTLTPLGGISVRLLQVATCLLEPPAGLASGVCPGPALLMAQTTTAANGTYAFDGVAPGDYKVRFVDPTGVHRGELFDDAPSVATAATVTVTGTTTEVASASLGLVGATVRGQVKQQGSGVNLPGISVRLLTTGNVLVGARITGADGRYSFADVPAADYVVRFIDLDASHVTEYHLDASSFGAATAVSTSVGASTTVDAHLASTSTGDVVGSVLEEGTGVPLVGVSVRLLNEGNVLVGARTVQTDGSFTFFDVAPGSYRVRFVDADGSHVGEYHLDAATFSAATPVGVTASTTTTVDATLAPT